MTLALAPVGGETDALREAELALVGSVLVDPVTLTREAVDVVSGDFLTPLARLAWEVFEDLKARKIPIDVIAVLDAMRARRPGVDSADVYGMVQAATNSPANSARIVKMNSLVRAVEFASAQASAIARRDPGAAGDALRAAQVAILELTIGRSGRRTHNMKDLAEQTIEEIDKYSQPDAKLPRVRTEITHLDFALKGGMRPGMVLAVGKTGHGKTSFALQIAVRAAGARQVPALIFPLEMTASECFAKMAGALSRVPTDVFEPGPKSMAEWETINRATQRMAKLNGLVEINESRTIDEITAAVLRWRQEHAASETAIVVVDYAQLVQSRPGARHGSRREEVEHIGRTLTGLAVEAKVTMLVTAQIDNDAVKEDRAPRLGDTRETKALEHDAKLVIGFHRDITEPNGICELTILKSRFSLPGVVQLQWVGEYQGLEEIRVPQAPRQYVD